MPRTFGISTPTGIGREVYTGGPQRIASAAAKAAKPDVNTLLAYAKLGEAKRKGIPDMGDVQKTAHYVSGLAPDEQSAWTSRYPALAGMIPKAGAVTPGMEVKTGPTGRTTTTMPGIREEDITSQIGKRTADITRGEAQTGLGQERLSLDKWLGNLAMERLYETQRANEMFNMRGAGLPRDLSLMGKPGSSGLSLSKPDWSNPPAVGTFDRPLVIPKEKPVTPPSPGGLLPDW